MNNPAHIKVLLADDEPFIRRIIRQVLSTLGYTQITEVDDGAKALASLETTHYDLILTDIQMPGINGLELLKRIRCGQTCVPRNARVAVITSFSNTEVLSAALGLDVNGFLVKPMKPAAVQEKLNTAVNEKFAAKPVEWYQNTITNLRSLEQEAHPDTAAAMNAGITKPTYKTETPSDLPEGAIQVSVLSARPGMKLCSELRLRDGTLILKPGNTFSESSINRVADMASLLADDMVWVLVPPES